MTNAEKKRYLNSYRTIKSRLKRLGSMYIQCDLDAMLPSIQSDGLPHAHNPHGLETYAEKRDKLERDIERTRRECLDKLNEIVWNIEQMADETEKSEKGAPQRMRRHRSPMRQPQRFALHCLILITDGREHQHGFRRSGNRILSINVSLTTGHCSLHNYGCERHRLTCGGILDDTFHSQILC